MSVFVFNKLSSMTIRKMDYVDYGWMDLIIRVYILDYKPVSFPACLAIDCMIQVCCYHFCHKRGATSSTTLIFKHFPLHTDNQTVLLKHLEILKGR